MTQPEMAPPERTHAVGNFALFSATGALLAVSVIIGYFVGLLLDRWLGTAPWLLLLFVGLGFAAGLYEVVHMVKTAARHNRRHRQAA